MQPTDDSPGRIVYESLENTGHKILSIVGDQLQCTRSVQKIG